MRVEWCAAIVLLVLSAPLLLALSILVAVTSKGPVGYSQLRVGRSGRAFRICKLRTMVHGCEARTGPVWAVPDDPRTTPVGRWLRDTHLDELPQLWNVVRGQMSLIGPRPERPEIAAQIERAIPAFRERLRVRPGITGLAQMRLPADSDLDSVRRKLDHDLYYIAHLGPSLDARIALSMSRRIARPIAVPATPPADPARAPLWLGARAPGARGTAVDVEVRPAGRRAAAALSPTLGNRDQVSGEGGARGAFRAQANMNSSPDASSILCCDPWVAWDVPSVRSPRGPRSSCSWRRPGRCWCIPAAVYVPHVYFATQLLSENLFAPALGLVVLLLLRSLRAGSPGTAAAAGLCLGVAVLTRPFAVLLVPVLALIVLAAGPRRRPLVRAVVGSAAFVLCTVAVVAPWTLRNLRVHRHAVLVATNGGSTFYGGNNDRVASLSPAIGTWVSTRTLPGRDRVDATPDEVAHDRLEWQLGLAWIRGHAGRLPLLLAAKAVRLALPDVDSASRRYVLLNALGATPILVLVARGMRRCAAERSRRTSPWLLVHAAMAATLLVGLIFWDSPRFRDANAPLLMLYAALGVGRGGTAPR